jgi:nucleoside-diphosphate-sugar epimerase
LTIILGLGFTGKRVAKRLLARGLPVAAAVRGVERFPELKAAGLRVVEFADIASLPLGARVFHSIPSLAEGEEQTLRRQIRDLDPARIVYISSTGVYGDQRSVDACTAPAPSDARGRARFESESWISGEFPHHLVLRAAAIYGPGRGIHQAVRENRMPRGGDAAVVSRIHVDDLAALAEAGLDSELTGAWPVADEAPGSSREIAEWCRKLLNLEEAQEPVAEFEVAGRRVDGREICNLLGVELQYPDWKTGIIASLGEEGHRRS